MSLDDFSSLVAGVELETTEPLNFDRGVNRPRRAFDRDVTGDGNLSGEYCYTVEFVVGAPVDGKYPNSEDTDRITYHVWKNGGSPHGDKRIPASEQARLVMIDMYRRFNRAHVYSPDVGVVCRDGGFEVVVEKTIRNPRALRALENVLESIGAAQKS